MPDYTSYFRLDTVVQEGMSTWEKSLAIGRWVSSHIPHANQKARPAAKDAITLWEFIQHEEPAFNCRYHSFFAMQLPIIFGALRSTKSQLFARSAYCR